MDRPAAPNVSLFAQAIAVLNACSSKPQLLVLGPGALFTGAPTDLSIVHPHVEEVLAAIRAKGIPVMIVSNGHQSSQLQPRLDAHKLGPFHGLACSSGSQWSDVVQGLRTKAGAQFQDMLLFDSDPALIRAGKRVGMAAHLARNGLTADALRQGLEAFAGRQLDARGF